MNCKLDYISGNAVLIRTRHHEIVFVKQYKRSPLF